MRDYSEPELTVAVLAFQRDDATRACLESVKRHLKVPHRVHLYHNGPSPAAGEIAEAYQVDLFLQSRANGGLGIGTRDLIASCRSPYYLYLQQDQVLARDLGETEWSSLKGTLGHHGIVSISLAGPVAGHGVYSERAYVGYTADYHALEISIPLSPGGAGPMSHLPWREGQIQQWYRDNGLVHFTDWPPLVSDRGVWTVRDNPDGSRLWMRTDTKAVWWEKAPSERYVFPEMSPLEWDCAISGGWVGGTIPEHYLRTPGASFRCWGPDEPPTFSTS